MITSVGPFALSAERLLILAGVAVALLIGWLLSRHRGQQPAPVIISMSVVGFVSARLTFVLLYLSDRSAQHH